ncbi:MAG: TylF/MycF family methyltransferase [Blastomonas sp.]|nr:TylF/MycF family methyltransferase [Blastomonas sp.]
MAWLQHNIRRVAGLAAYRHRSVRAVRATGLTYLEAAALADLVRAVRNAEKRGVAGTIIEAGCALGGSAIVMTKAAKRQVEVYDVFGMPPPPGIGDGPDVHQRYEAIAHGHSEGIDGHTYYGYVEGLLATVRTNFRRHGIEPDTGRVTFVEGLLQDTLELTGPVAVAHIDCDRYESVRVCLERIAPRLSVGGVMIFDDYDSKSGCRKAVDEYFTDRLDEFRLQRHSRLHAVRHRDVRQGAWL